VRSTCAFVLVLVATLVAPLVIATSWLSSRIDDRQEYVETVGPLADDAEVRRLMSRVVADAAVDALQQHVPVQLPAALGDWAHVAADQVIESPEFPRFWRQANADVHTQVMRIVDDPHARADGYVVVDASPLLAQVLLSLEEKGVPVRLLPPVPLQVPVAPESRLVEVGDAYRTTTSTAGWLPVVWFGLVALAVLVAPGVRGRLRTLGLALLGVALAAALVMLAVEPVAQFAADQAAAGQEELTELMLEIALGSLTPYARGFLLAAPLGLVVVLLPTLAGWVTRRSPSSAT
jgi:hypothetical protein